MDVSIGFLLGYRVRRDFITFYRVDDSVFYFLSFVMSDEILI